MAAKRKKAEEAAAPSYSELLRCEPGPVDLSRYDARATPGAIGDKEATLARMPELGSRLAELQERLFARSRAADDKRRVLLVLQGMDTAGKGGVVGHVIGMLDPYAPRITAFKKPTPEELAHDFLWRIRKALPEAGHIGIFDRSHYEDVLIARVRRLVSRETWTRRYGSINNFEEKLVADGCTVVKCFLHISPQTQKERLLARLDNPVKRWKYNPGDVDERLLWPAYMEAYAAALEKCDTDAAPWYVIPSDRKWYRNFAITMLLTEAFESLGELEWPPGEYDLEVERRRVVES